VPRLRTLVLKNAVSWDFTQCGFVRTDVSEERIVPVIRVTRIDELGTVIHFTLMTEEIRSSETSVLTRATRYHIPEYSILHSQGRENLKSYIPLTGWTL
jgi:hypothetical protein